MNKFVLLLLLGLLFFGCFESEPPVDVLPEEPPEEPEPLQVELGDGVHVYYVGKLDDGHVFDTNIQEEAEKAGIAKPNYEPLGFIVGAGAMIPGFEEAVIGMQEGEEKTVTLPPEKAYGPIREDFIVTINESELPFDEPVGLGAIISTPEGLMGIVTSVDSGEVTVDFNHELAGKNLTFQIIVQKIFRS